MPFKDELNWAMSEGAENDTNTLHTLLSVRPEDAIRKFDISFAQAVLTPGLPAVNVFAQLDLEHICLLLNKPVEPNTQFHQRKEGT